MFSTEGVFPEQQAERKRFLHELHRLARDEDMFPFTLVATATSGENTVIVVYRETLGGRLLGRFYDYPSLARDFDGSSPEQIADAVVVNEITDPSGPGTIRDYRWERRLTGFAEPVQWLDDPIDPLIDILPTPTNPERS